MMRNKYNQIDPGSTFIINLFKDINVVLFSIYLVKIKKFDSFRNETCIYLESQRISSLTKLKRETQRFMTSNMYAMKI